MLRSLSAESMLPEPFYWVTCSCLQVLGHFLKQKGLHFYRLKRGTVWHLVCPEHVPELILTGLILTGLILDKRKTSRGQDH